MQQRHQNRELYFREQVQTCRRHYIPYLQPFIRITPRTHVLEIGCGEGGNLLPFAQAGCRVTGIDLAAGRIDEAHRFFRQAKAQGTFIPADILQYTPPAERGFDLILMHDDTIRTTAPECIRMLAEYYRNLGYRFEKLTPETEPIRFNS